MAYYRAKNTKFYSDRALARGRTVADSYNQALTGQAKFKQDLLDLKEAEESSDFMQEATMYMPFLADIMDQDPSAPSSSGGLNDDQLNIMLLNSILGGTT